MPYNHGPTWKDKQEASINSLSQMKNNVKKNVGLPISDGTLKDLDDLFSDALSITAYTTSTYTHPTMVDGTLTPARPKDGEILDLGGRKFMWCGPDGNWIEI